MVDPYRQDIAYSHASTAGDLKTVSGLENLRDALIRRWITEPGTYVYRPSYGAGLLRFQNEPLTVDTQRRIARAIEEQTKQEKRVEEVRSIGFSIDDTLPGRLDITVVVKPIGQNDLTVLLSIGG